MKQRVLKIHPKDNVLVALQNLVKGETIQYEGEAYILQEDINAKHKFFMQDMNTGDKVIMYGVLVGTVQSAVSRGSKMATANTKHAAEPYSYRPYHYQWQAPDVSKFKDRVFQGYHRSDGKVGTANYWLFIPTVFCENRNLDVIREALHNELGYAVTDRYKHYAKRLVQAWQSGQDITGIDLPPVAEKENRVFKNIDGVKFLNHQGGCGGTRQDAATLSKLLAAYADHPNVAGVTIMSLGCQNLQVPQLLQDIKDRNPGFKKPLLVFEQQQSQSEEQLIAAAIRTSFEGMVEANKIE
ncbi:MAG TPA: UxaA family hydrolase, partial [Chitinophagaceae bacterium]|nr:UxaA family hydrolase [Chitinophagaceae bacterium]